MKTRFILFILPFFFLSGCLETPYKRGEAITYTAILGLDAEQLTDEQLSKIKSDLILFLESNQTVTTIVIQRYSNKLAKYLNRDPRRIRLVLTLLSNELDYNDGTKRAREFIRGVLDTLTQLGY